MSTVSSPPPPRTGGAAPVGVSPARGTMPIRRKRRGGMLMVTVACVAVLALGAYFAIFRGWSDATTEAGVTTYPVSRKSFTVKLNEKGELEATNSVDVKCEVEGRSTILWLIAEGTEAKKGDLLAKIASNEIDDKLRAEQIKVQNAKATAEAATQELEITLDQHASDIRKAELTLSNAQTELEKYLKGDYGLQLLEKDLAVETAKKTWEQAKSTLVDSEELFKKKFITERELEGQQLEEYKAGVEVQKSERSKQVFLKYDHPKSLQQKQSDIEEATKELERTRKKALAEAAKLRANSAAKNAEYELIKDRLAKLTEQREKTEIHAPADGLVVYFTGMHRWNRVQMTEGAEVFERQTLITLPDTTEMKVKLRIHEAKTSMIALGQPVTVEVEGIPGEVFSGKVTRIAPLADSQNDWLNPNLKEYATEVTLDPTTHELKPGVTARAEILVRHVEDVIAVPVQAVYSRNGRTYAFVGKNEKVAKPVEIETGHSNDQFVEVRGGLQEGDRVLLAHDDMLLAKLPDEVERGPSAERKKRPPASHKRSGKKRDQQTDNTTDTKQTADTKSTASTVQQDTKQSS